MSGGLAVANPSMRKAREVARAAHLLCEFKLFSGIADRAYFAMFHAARALLRELANIELKARHSPRATHSLFALHIVKEGRFDVGLARQLRRAAKARILEARENATVSNMETLRLLKVMDKFLLASEALLAEPRP